MAAEPVRTPVQPASVVSAKHLEQTIKDLHTKPSETPPTDRQVDKHPVPVPQKPDDHKVDESSHHSAKVARHGLRRMRTPPQQKSSTRKSSHAVLVIFSLAFLCFALGGALLGFLQFTRNNRHASGDYMALSEGLEMPSFSASVPYI